MAAVNSAAYKMLVAIALGSIVSAPLAQTAVSTVRIVSDSSDRELSREQEAILVAGTEAILNACLFNSETPGSRVSWPADTEGEWNRWLARDHLLIRYEKLQTFETPGGVVNVDELMLRFPAGDIPSAPLSKSESGVTLYSKCHGFAIIDLTCTREVESVMRESYQAYCRDYRETGRPVFYRPGEDR